MSRDAEAVHIREGESQQIPLRIWYSTRICELNKAQHWSYSSYRKTTVWIHPWVYKTFPKKKNRVLIPIGQTILYIPWISTEIPMISPPTYPIMSWKYPLQLFLVALLSGLGGQKRTFWSGLATPSGTEMEAFPCFSKGAKGVGPLVSSRVYILFHGFQRKRYAFGWVF